MKGRRRKKTLTKHGLDSNHDKKNILAKNEQNQTGEKKSRSCPKKKEDGEQNKRSLFKVNSPQIVL